MGAAKYLHRSVSVRLPCHNPDKARLLASI